jgi:DNA-binding beta-propeller fold protein YncE
MKNTKTSVIAHQHRRNGRLRAVTFIAGLLTLASLFLVSTAAATAPDFLFQVPEGSGAPSPAGGQLNGPGGIATDPTTGRIYVADSGNERISEFTAWGTFVKAWGWGVVASGPDNEPQNEIQKVTVEATGGAFELRYYNGLPSSGGPLRQDTDPIPFNASATIVQSALEGLFSFDPGDLSVSGPNGGPWTIEFTASHADEDVPPLVVVESTLSGGGAMATVQTVQGGANFEICRAEDGDICRQGQGGRAGRESTSPGEFTGPSGIALDSAGNIYVFDSRTEIFGTGENERNLRVQKFDPEGHFLAMFGGEVDKTTKANLCTKADLEGGDECGAGVPGTGPGEFSNSLSGNYLTYNSVTDTTFVGDTDRIEEFNLDGTFKSQISFEGDLQAFDGRSVDALASDSAGNLYLALQNTENLYKLSPTGEPLEPGTPGASSFKVTRPAGSVVLNADGNVYAIDDPPGDFLKDQARVVEFDPTAKQLLPTQSEEENEELFPYLPSHGPSLNGLATSVLGPGSTEPGDLYLTVSGNYGINGPPVAYLNAYGPSPITFEDPPKRAPDIAAQYATSVGRNDATLQAQINPHFWPDSTYGVQYGTGKCSDGGCVSEKPLGPGFTLTSRSLNNQVKTAGVFLADLSAGTTYHYRFVSQSSGSEGETVLGVGGKPGQEGEEGTFRTFSAPTVPQSCPANEAFRTGPSAKLSDCRAYELVSPLDKEGGDAWLLPPTKVFFEVNQSATSGDRFTYSSMTAFADPQSTPYISQYLASRDPQVGWSNQSISPPRSARPLRVTRSLTNEFKAFSPDLCEAWLVHNSVSPLAEGAIPGYANLYHRRDCGPAPSYEALSTTKPPERPATEYSGLGPMGSSEDGTTTIFVADDKLTEDAPTLNAGLGEEEAQLLLYEHSPEGLRYVCYLPKGTPNQTACAAGLPAGSGDAHASAVQNAISANGSLVFWTAYKGALTVGSDAKPGNVYVRLNPDQEQSKVVNGKCTEATKACTIAVSGSVSPEAAAYWGAADDGSKAIFEIVEGALAGNLYEFDVATKKAHLIAEGVLGPMGMSEDASRVYFASTKALAAGASDGARNLYLYEAPQEEEGEGSFGFIMALAPRDLLGTELEPGAIDVVPNKRSVTVSADGLYAAFTSSASPTPTGYDNLDAASGEADEEAYLYDATQHELRCVSCNPTGARPTGENLRKDNLAAKPVWAAARLPNRRMPLEPPHPLSEGGSRLFFESHEALVPRDTNGTWDVYQWEALGTGSCTEADSTYGDVSKGCVDLISSGESPEASKFLDADPLGRNVFIGTQGSLLSFDYGLADVYDARVGGGLPEPPSLRAGCEGEACQGPLAAPNDPTPSSSSFEGAGNVAKGARVRCAKAKVRHKGRCVARHRKQATHKRRAGR